MRARWDSQTHEPTVGAPPGDPCLRFTLKCGLCVFVRVEVKVSAVLWQMSGMMYRGARLCAFVRVEVKVSAVLWQMWR